MSKKKPPAPQPIITAVLPAICPACASKDVGRVDTFGVWTLRCQACDWIEKYQIRKEVMP